MSQTWPTPRLRQWGVKPTRAGARSRHNDFREGRLTCGATVGERARRQSRLGPRGRPAQRCTRKSARGPTHTSEGGLEVPNESIAGADGSDERGAAVGFLGRIGTRPCASATLVRTRPSQARPLRWVEEAGPWGEGRYRDRPPQPLVCGGVAPARSPTPPGARVQTDRRAARPRARLRRCGARTPVDVPAGADAARRARARAREEACRRRPEIRDDGRAPWGPAPRRGRAAVVWPTPAPPRVVPADGRAGPEPSARCQRRAQARHAPGHAWRGPP